jgi:hypothetical protein
MDENWLPALREIYQALDNEALAPVVIGGRALLLLRPSIPKVVSEIDLSMRLSAFARVTYDLDLAILAGRDRLRAAHDVLTRQMGFRWDGVNEHRYTRGEGDTEVVVDVLKAQKPPDRNEEWSVPWILPIIAELGSVETEGLRVMHPAGLVVLKAIAAQSNPRRRSRDYVDLALLALRDRDGGTRLALETLVPRLRKRTRARAAIQDLRNVRKAFADESASGSIMVARELLAGTFSLEDGGDAISATLLVSAAVRRLLESVPE